jgi:hypothetical protein
MRNAIHKFMLLCGAVLIFLRFLPAKPGGWLSQLFVDEIIYSKLNAWSTTVILSMGVKADAYQSQIAGLASLAHAMALIAQALLIALVFYIATRWI